MSQVRKAYTIRTPLDLSYFSQPITLSSQSGDWTMEHQITLLTFLSFIASIIFLFFIMFMAPLDHAGSTDAICFIVSYIIFIMELVAPTKTQLVGAHLLKPTWQYFTDVNRKIGTRPASPDVDVTTLIGIKGVTPDHFITINDQKLSRSMLVFNNGDRGEIMEVSGNASVLTFSSEQFDILKSADVFYRGIHNGISFTIDSVLSPQRIDKQERGKAIQLMLMKQYGNTNTNLVNQVRYELYRLQTYVGKKFKAWHQYMIVRGPHTASIRIFNSWLQQCIDSGLYLNGYRRLSSGEMIKYLRDIYGDDVSLSSIKFHKMEQHL